MKVVDETKKNDEAKVYYDTVAHNEHATTQIDLSGWRQELLLTSSEKGNTTRQ